MQTRPHNRGAFKSNFHIVGFQGVYNICFSVSAVKYRLWVLVRTASAIWFQQVFAICLYFREIREKKILSTNCHFNMVYCVGISTKSTKCRKESEWAFHLMCVKVSCTKLNLLSKEN